MTSTPQPPAAGRIASLDQFRGYTVAGMLLVNFIGGFDEVGAILEAPQHVLQLCRHDHAAVLLRGRLRVPAHVPEAAQAMGDWPAARAACRATSG